MEEFCMEENNQVLSVSPKERIATESTQGISLRCSYPGGSSPFSAGSKVETTICADNLYLAQETQVVREFRIFCGKIVNILTDKSLLHD